MGTLTLLKLHTDRNRTAPVYVNPRFISSIQKHGSGGSIIGLQGDGAEVVHVTEAPGEIFDLFDIDEIDVRQVYDLT